MLSSMARGQLLLSYLLSYTQTPYNAKRMSLVGTSSTLSHSNSLSLVLYVWHQSNVACSLDCYSKRSLVLSAVSGNSSRKNLTSFRDVFS